jgi:arylsulfatase A-like enzyme
MYHTNLGNGTSVVLISIDATRPDVLLDGETTPAPFLRDLFEENFTLTSCFSTGYPTQFALPGLMSSTLPLDHGGYDYGIRDRPTAVAEVFADRGYDTVALVNGFMTGRLFSYNRGFETYCNLDSLESWLGSLRKLYLRY